MLISVDWGTTNARAWLLDDGGEIRLRASSKAGMGGLSADEFPAALETLVGAWRADHPDVPVLLSGMVGAKGGWREAGYVGCPFDAATLAEGLVEAAPGVHIVPGAKTLRTAGTQPVRDVMRGEEVQILGALAGEEGLTQLCLPGTHSKWVELSRGRALDFTTYMTGELFALLADESILARSVGDPAASAFGSAFEDGVEVGRAAPVASAIFGVRTRDVVGGLPPRQNRAFLSGVLIGHEVANAVSAAPLTKIGLCGQGSLVALYARALRALDVDVAKIDVEAATLRGHRAVAKAAGLVETGS
ncbi:MAG: 2-dehydro-3-deoxygalactonokinase [Pseudomonadota bacterium]